MARDCYAILGVTPSSEDVVIHAAYRALMRRYHPDANAAADAEERVREISAAYAVLRDPAKRREYDSLRASGQPFWIDQDPLRPPPPPAKGRAAGISAAVLAVLLVGAVWAWPQSDPLAPRRTPPAAPVADSPPEPRLPPVAVDRDPVLREALAVPAAPDPVADPQLDMPIENAPEPQARRMAPLRVAAPTGVAARRRPVDVAPRPAARLPQPELSPPTADSAGTSGRLEALERQATALFSQSLLNADPERRSRLGEARDRLLAARSACRSDSCLTGAYLAHMREVGAVMAARNIQP